MITTMEISRNTDLDQAIDRTVRYLLSIQHDEGYWWGELESNVTITSEHLFLTHILGIGTSEEWRKIANYLRQQQREDGTWAIYYDGPGDLSTTVEAYTALKMVGTDSEEPFMKKARDFILSKGGVEEARIFTKIWLAMLGEWPWEGIPILPPEIVLFPRWFPFNIYEFSSWARGTIVPLTIIQAFRPVFPIPAWARIPELFKDGPERVDLSLPRKDSTWGSIFLQIDRVLRIYDKISINPLRRLAIKMAEQWILARQEADGSWGGIQPPWVYSLIALKCLGYTIDHPVMKKGIAGFYGPKGFGIEEGDTFRLQSCISPGWDTGLAMIGLLDAGLPGDHPALVKAGEWLIHNQIFSGGDWQVKCKARPGGWAFEFENANYPDTDDTAVVMIAIMRTDLDGDKKQQALQRGLEWLLAMQSSNGGWGAFDVDNCKAFLREIPFADFGEMIDPPSVDVTAHIVELLGKMGYRRGWRPLDRALDYLRREQEEDGAWYGRWGVNTIYGTGCVLPALEAIEEDMRAPYIRKAVEWLLSRQNEDGGWGERIESYRDPSWRGRGPSTASQTGWALLALIAAGERESKAVRRGVEYLIQTQREDGSWDEPYFTGTGFPLDFMINYHLYRNYFPLMALGRYRQGLHHVTGYIFGSM